MFVACLSGWVDTNTLHCYKYSGGVTFANAHAECASMYDRAFPAYYDSHTEYYNAWAHIGQHNDFWWGYHRVDGRKCLTIFNFFDVVNIIGMHTTS